MNVAGACIPVECDHSNDKEVEGVFELIAKENDNRIDLLVNNVFAAVSVSCFHLVFTRNKVFELQSYGRKNMP